MPGHFHMIVPARSPRGIRRRLGRLLSGHTRRMQRRRLWESIPAPSVIPDRKHLARQVRYVHLNPSRSGLVDDPLCWPWSTHRGVVGAEHDAWVTSERLAHALGWVRRGFEAEFHAYVSGDPTVTTSGTPLPRPAAPRDIPAEPLLDIVQAATSAMPWSRPATWRRAAVQLAWRQGWRNSRWVAQALGVTSRCITRLASTSDEPFVVPAALCLGDRRLLLPPELMPAELSAERKVTPP
jgi:hypothetical protein